MLRRQVNLSFTTTALFLHCQRNYDQWRQFTVGSQILFQDVNINISPVSFDTFYLARWWRNATGCTAFGPYLEDAHRISRPLVSLTLDLKSSSTTSGRFAKITESDYFVSSCLSVPTEQLESHSTDFHEIWYPEYFSKICTENSSFTKIWQNNGHFTWRNLSLTIKPRSILLRMRNVSDKSCRWNQNTYFRFRKSYHLWDNVGKNGTAGRHKTI